MKKQTEKKSACLLLLKNINMKKKLSKMNTKP